MRKTINIKKIGALTSKPYAFKSRSWELKTLESIDLQDSLGSNIKINYRGSEIMRILPNINEFINEEWITDKCRFSYDAINRWRFDTPLIKENNIYTQYSWKEVFNKIKYLIKSNNIKNIISYVGPYSSLENIIVLKDLLTKKENFHFQTNSVNNTLNNDFLLKNLLMQNTFKIKKSNIVFFFLGINLRIENPILNLRFRKLSKKKNILLFNIGGSYNNTCYMYHLGNNIKHIYKILEGKHYANILISKFLNKNNKINSYFQNPINIIIGNNINSRADSQEIINSLNNSKIKCNLINIFEYSGFLNGNYLNFTNINKILNKRNTLFYLLGTENIKDKIKKNDLILFQGHHNTKLRKNLDIILPSNIYLEEENTYLNCLNIIQQTKGINPFFKKTKEDWLILKFFGKYVLNVNLNYKNKKEIFNRLNQLIGDKKLNYISNKKNFSIKKNLKNKHIINSTAIKNVRNNYHLNTSVDKASKIMNASSKEFYNNKYIYLWN